MNLYGMCKNNTVNLFDIKGEDWLDCMDKCIKDNDPVDYALGKVLGLLAGIPIPKTFVADLAKSLGDEQLYRGIMRELRNPAASRYTSLPSSISAKLRHGGRSALRRLGRYANSVLVAYGLALAAIEAHCSCVCITCSWHGVRYDSSMGIKESLKSYFD